MHHLSTPIKTIIWEELTNNDKSGRSRKVKETNKSTTTRKETKCVHTSSGTGNRGRNRKHGPEDKSGQTDVGIGNITRGRPKNKNQTII